MEVAPRYKLLTLHTLLTLLTLLRQLHVCPHTCCYMVRSLKEYGGSTALYTAYVVYTVCLIFKLLCTACMPIYIVKED